MKKISKIILSYLLITFNSYVLAVENNNTNILKIGILAPFSGEFKSIGETVLYSVNLALHDINDDSIKIYPKDSGSDKEKILDCQLYQRSGDMFLGVPFNITSYAFLLCIIGHITGYKPRKFIHIIGDAHIYEEHLEAVTKQISRDPVLFPTLNINPFIENIDEIREDQFKINQYRSYSRLSAPMIA